jgi:DNA-binding CsgD family transcriptional regulator
MAAHDRRSFQHDVLEVFDRAIGFSGAFFLSFQPLASIVSPTLVASGLAANYGAQLTSHLPSYDAEIAPVKVDALSHEGVAVDTQVLGVTIKRTRYYNDLVRPSGGRHSLLCFLALRGEPQGLIMIGRAERSPFRDRDLDRVRALRPVLTLALASFARPTVSDGLALTPREREIGNYLLLGYTNREIALGLGSSPNTVRNQLAALFRKAEVSTRAELVARLLGR